MFTVPAKLDVELRAKIGHYRNRSFALSVLCLSATLSVNYINYIGDISTVESLTRPYIAWLVFNIHNIITEQNIFIPIVLAKHQTTKAI